MIYHLFDVVGIELEYMIVNQSSFNINPICDKLLEKANGSIVDTYTPKDNKITWSNELSLHLIEFKTSEPVKNFNNLDLFFMKEVKRANVFLTEENSLLMPSATHPWMNPNELKLWPHDSFEIYDTFNKIFNCKGHGWANLQSMHINLPFYNDEEFVKLHSAIRLILPIIPALSASSPIMDSKITGLLDTRLDFYSKNCSKIPSITGLVVPEYVKSIKDYKENILLRIYKDIEIYDEEKIISEEWVNARGAIARFDRNAIEIRVIDVQECPKADLAIAELVFYFLKYLCNENINLGEKIDTKALYEIMKEIIKNGLETKITNLDYLKIFNINSECKVKDIFEKILKKIELSKESLLCINYILKNGNLANRILKFVNNDTSKLKTLAEKLTVCLSNNIQL